MANTLNHWADILVIVLYFTVAISVGIWSICRPTAGDVKGFFLAGRSMPWLPIAFSIFGTNMGGASFIGLAGSAAASGIAVVLFEWNAIFLILLLAWVFMPVYISCGITTLPEFLEKRYGGRRLRAFLTFWFLVTGPVLGLSFSLYGGGLFVQQALGWNLYAAIFLFLGLTALYTVLGGLSTVMITDTMSVFIMITGSCVLTIYGLVHVGGYENMKAKYMTAIPDFLKNNTNTTCGRPRDDAFHLFRDPLYSDYPWPAMIMRMTFGAVWFWCGSQVMVQRVLTAKNIVHAKAGCIAASYLKLTPMFFMIFPGLLSRVLYPNEVACVDEETCQAVCGNPAGCSNIAFPKIALTLLPPGLRGMMLSVMLSAVISTLTSELNSISTNFTLDFWHRLRTKASERELLLVGRVYTGLMCGLSILWIPIMTSAEGGQLFRYGTMMSGYLSGPISAVFLAAVFWEKANEKGAFFGLVIAQCMGVIRFILGLIYREPACGENDKRPIIISAVNGYYYAAMQVVVGLLIIVIVSLLTEPEPNQQLEGLTYWTRFKYKKSSQAKENNEIGVCIEELDAKESTRVDENGSPTHSVSATCMYTTGEDEAAVDNSAEKEVKVTQNTDEDEIKLDNSAEAKVKVKDHVDKAGRWWICRRWARAICGAPTRKPFSAQDVMDTVEKRQRMLDEPKFWRIVLNINAVLVLAVLIALYAIFH